MADEQIFGAYRGREQALIKHTVLRRYLEGFVPIVGNWADDIAYVDCFAGPWNSADAKYKDTSFGIAVDVLQSARRQLIGLGKNPPTMRCLFVEKNHAAYASLKTFSDQVTTTSPITARAENWDCTKHIDDVVRYVQERPRTFPFIFLDPKGYAGVRIRVIEPLLRLQRVEVLITLMISFGKRFLGDETKKLDALVGGGANHMHQLHGDRREEAMVQGYADRIRAIGRFEYVCSAPVMDPERDLILYHLIYATRHPKGVKVFKAAEKIVVDLTHEIRSELRAREEVQKSGGFFWAPTEVYPEPHRLTRLHHRNAAVARQRLVNRIVSQGSITVEQAWIECAQFATVTIHDFRTWISEMRKVGFIRLDPDSKVPRTDTDGQSILWTGLPQSIVGELKP